MPPVLASRHFSGSYAEARQKFLATAALVGAAVDSHVLPGQRGAMEEELAMDVARLGAPDARRLLIMTSATHGPEGFCGSGVQIATLHDAGLRQRLDAAGVALLLVHAVNPYGFSHLHRTNEDNIDLNRNFIAFDRPLPVNARYAEVEPLALPDHWPPTPADEAALAGYVQAHGHRAYMATVTTGQYTSPTGLFYGGQGASWSNRTLRGVLRQHAGNATHIGWIDVHTGLGPYGHGEKIYAGRNMADDLARARAWWGADVFAPFAGQSASADVSGPVVSCIHDECPQADVALMGLEFGTLPDDDMILALRADHWLMRHPEAPPAQHIAIRRQMRDAFYCDNGEWKGMILGQARTVLLQTIEGLKAA